MARVINLIGRGGTDTAAVTATASDVLSGKIIVDAVGAQVTGTMKDNSYNADTLNDDGEFDIKLDNNSDILLDEGYYNAPTHISVISLAEATQSSNEPEASDILSGFEVWANGQKIVGTMKDYAYISGGEITYVLPGATIEVPAGVYLAEQVIKGISLTDSVGEQAMYKGTAKSSDILLGKTAWVNGVLITGDMGVVNPDSSIELEAGQTLDFISAFYDKDFTVSVPTLESLTIGTATAVDIVKDKIAWVNGVEIIGTYEPGEVGDFAVATVADATCDDIIANKTAWVNGELVIGCLDPTTLPGHIAYYTPGDATSYDIIEGKTAWVNGSEVIGSIPVQTNTTIIADNATTYELDAGYYSTPITVTVDFNQLTCVGTETKSSDIKYGMEAWVNGELITGTLDINNIVNEDGTTSTGITFAEATAGDATNDTLLAGKTAWVNGEQIVGTIDTLNYPGLNLIAAGEFIDIPSSYHETPFTVKAKELDVQTPGTANAVDIAVGKTAWVNGVQITGTYEPGEVGDFATATSASAVSTDILNTKTAWVNGVQLTGSMPNNGAKGTKKPNENGNPPTLQSGEVSFDVPALNAGQSFVIPAGYTEGGTVWAQELYGQTSGTATADSIIAGKTAWVNGVQITGTVDLENGTTTPGNATADDLLEGKTAWVDGEQLTGTISIYDGESEVALASKEDIVIPAGVYISEDITITGKDIHLQTPGTATSGDIKLGKTAWVNGVQISGTLLGTGGSGESVDLAELTVGTANADKILFGDTAWVNGVKITGTMPNNGILGTEKYIVLPEVGEETIPGDGEEIGGGEDNPTVEDGDDVVGEAPPEDVSEEEEGSANEAVSAVLAGESYIIPAGYTEGGTVWAAPLSAQTEGTATAGDLLEGQTAWVNGELITGTIPVTTVVEGEDAEVIEVAAGDTYTVPAGYYGEGALTITNEKLGYINGTATAADVVAGKTININNRLVTGTLEKTVAMYNGDKGMLAESDFISIEDSFNANADNYIYDTSDKFDLDGADKDIKYHIIKITADIRLSGNPASNKNSVFIPVRAMGGAASTDLVVSQFRGTVMYIPIFNSVSSVMDAVPVTVDFYMDTLTEERKIEAFVYRGSVNTTNLNSDFYAGATVKFTFERYIDIY